MADPRQNFRLKLQTELVARCEKNPSYSLRAYAKHLDINPATLSSMLSQKRPITDKTIRKLGSKLELTPKEINGYIEYNDKPTFSQYQEFTQDLFNATSDWYHDAILELTHVKTFKADPRWIAKVLNIHISQATAAIDRLQRLELLEVKNGKWIDTSRNNTNTLDSDFSTAAMRKYQRQILEKSIKALEDLPRTERDHTSMMVSGSHKDLKIAKKMITEFRHKLAAFLERRSSAPQEVYQLSVSLFPITKIKKEEITNE